MRLFEEFKEYELLWDESKYLVEGYTLEAHGYKVGDLVEIESYSDYPSPLHGMVLDCFDTNSKIIGVMLLVGNCYISDTPLNEIYKKISEKDLTKEEKANYEKQGKPACERKIKELSADTTQEEKPAEEKTTQATEPKNAKLNKARQANLKIIKAFKEVGLATDDLTITAQNKNGKNYKKASDKLNKLRKTLFGESLEEAFDDEYLIEAPGPGGQRTYKDFLIYLAKFFGLNIPANYDDSWVLHHVNCDHFKNEFDNLALMNNSHHISFHKQLAADPNKDALNFLKNGTTKNGDSFEYWPIGNELLACVTKALVEPPASEIIKQEEK